MTDNFMMSDEVMGHDQIDLSLEMETMEKKKRKGKQEVSYEMEVSQDEGGSQQGPSNCRGWAKKKQRVIRESCLVCLENYAQTRQKVSCEKCEYHACQGCVQRYLEEKQAEPHCMNCKEEFSMLFVYSNLQKPWLTTSMKEIRCNNLFQEEKSVFPHCQDMVLNYRHSKELTDRNDAIKKEISELRAKMRELQNSSQFYKNMVQEYKRSHYRVNLREVDTEENRNRVAAHSGGLVLQCQDEKCNGFLCNRTYMCNSCGKKTCPSCHTIADDDNHQCKEEDLESVRLLQQDTKSCPKCSMGVHKIEGCDQMFCTACKTPFSWATGRIIVGSRLHNPHYFDWLREQSVDGEIPRQEGDEPLERVDVADRYNLPSIREREIWAEIGLIDPSKRDSMGDCKWREFRRRKLESKCVESDMLYDVESMMAFYRSMRDRLQSFLQNTETLNNTHGNSSDLRLKFLLNQIDEQEFKSQLYKKDKNKTREDEFKKVYLKTFNNVVQALGEIKSFEAIQKTKDSIRSICISADGDLKLARKYFGGSVPFLLLDNYQWHLQRATLHHCDFYEDQAYNEDYENYQMDYDPVGMEHDTFVFG